MSWIIQRPKPWSGCVDGGPVVTDKRKEEPMDVCAEREKARKAEDKATEEELKRYQAEDQAAFERSKTYVPDVSVKDYPNGAWLCSGDVEVPVKHIVSIEVVGHGRPPGLDALFSLGVYARPATQAAIKITTVGGGEKLVRCDRHVTDFVLEALTDAWKGVKPKRKA